MTAPVPQPNPLPIRRAAGQGFGSLWRCKGMVFPLYLANLLTALFALLPFYLVLHDLTALRPAAARLLQTWDLEILAELAQDNPALVSLLKGLFVFVPMGYLLLTQVLLGGVLGALHRDSERPTLGQFGRDALHHLPRLLWVLLWSALPYLVVGLLLFVGMHVAEDRAWWAIVLILLPELLLLVWIDAALDFARIETVTAERRSSVKRLLYGFWAVLRRPVATLSIHLGFALAGLAPVAVLLLLPSTLDAGGNTAILLTFLVQQLVIFSRVALRVASLGSHLVLYGSIFPKTPCSARLAK